MLMCVVRKPAVPLWDRAGKSILSYPIQCFHVFTRFSGLQIICLIKIFDQANYLLSYVLLDFAANSGPTHYPGQVGSDLMERLIFGTNVLVHFGGTPAVNEPTPLTNITAVYKLLIQSAMKAGGLATENVSGGYTEEQMVFTSSLGRL
jgi:hypothetical protein